MAHLTLQLGGPVVVPFSLHFGGRQRRGPNWKVRCLLEAFAIDAGLPVQRLSLHWRRALRARSGLVALDGDIPHRKEV